MSYTHQYWVYMIADQTNSTLYTGVTNDLDRRVVEHKSSEIEGFTKRYNCTRLVYFEEFSDVSQAIAREKQLKNWKREWKNALVETINPKWNDLSTL